MHKAHNNEQERSRSTQPGAGLVQEINKYLRSVLNSATSKKMIKEAVFESATSAEETMKVTLVTRGGKVFAINTTLDASPSKCLSKASNNSPESPMSNKERFEAQLRELRLQQSLKERKELEEKLKMLDESINAMSFQGNPLDKKVQIKEYSWLSEKDRQKWKEDWERKVGNAKEFTKKMNEIQKSIKARKKLSCEKSVKELEENSANNQEEMLKEMEEKKKRKEEKRKEREELMKYAKLAVPKEERLYKRMMRHFQSEVVLPELEKRKQFITEKKSLYKPIRKPEIEEGLKSHDSYLRKMEEERERRKEKFRREQMKYFIKVDNELKSVFMEDLIKKEQEEKRLRKELEIMEKEKYHKRLSYAKLVQENYAPKISETKMEELKKMIEKLKHPTRKNRVSTSKTPAETTKADVANNSCETVEKKILPCKHKNKLIKSVKNLEPDKILSQKGNKSEFMKKIDYWTKEIKYKIPHRKPDNGGVFDYDQIIKNDELSAQEKYELIKSKANVMTENARKKENQLQVKANTDACKEISEIYLSAIKAKLSLMNI